MSGLDAAIALGVCIFAAFGLRALIAGERFDRALHWIDPSYRNTREMAQSVLIDPVDGVKSLPRAYGRYYGVMYRPVGDPEVERLRRRAVRAFLEFAIFGVGSLLAVLGVGALLRRVSLGLHDIAVLATLVLLGLYWVRQLTHELRDPERSTMAALYMLAGLAAVLAAMGLIVGIWSDVV